MKEWLDLNRETQAKKTSNPMGKQAKLKAAKKINIYADKEFEAFEKRFESYISHASVRRELMQSYEYGFKAFSDPCVIVTPDMTAACMSFMYFYDYFIQEKDKAEYMRIWNSKTPQMIPVMLSSVDWNAVPADENLLPRDYYYQLLMVLIDK